MTDTRGEFAAPMSFAQERLWFLDRLDSGRSTYNIPMSMYLQGQVEPETVLGALTDLANRHEILRTTFRVIGGQPVQVVSPEPNARLDVFDLTGLPPSQRRAEAIRRAQAALLEPFDLAHGPLLRASLVRLSTREHVLILTLHHIIADLWSSSVLFRDLNALIEARRRGVPANLPELPIQYADFAEWQRARLTGTTLKRLLDYWTQRLADGPSEVTFPFDRPRPPSQTFRGETVHFKVRSAVTRELSHISREEGATLFMTLLAAFKFLLGRYAGMDDVVVGTPIANRTRPEVENLIGFFSNTLVLRTGLDGNPTFRQLVGRVKTVTLGAYDHQDLPFEQLVAVLRPERNLSHGPLFQVLFGLQTTQQTGPAESQASDWGKISTGASKFDVTVLIQETELGLEGGFEYCSDLYDRKTIEVILEQYCKCLEVIAGNPDLTLREIARLAFPAERGPHPSTTEARASEAWRTTPVEQFKAQVRSTPEAKAVVAGGGSLTFRQLDALSNQIGWLLRSSGVRPGDRVGICMPAALEQSAAVLGVLKAGAAYVPLDPAYPAPRLAYMSEDACLALVLTGRSTAGLLPESVGPRITLHPVGHQLRDQPTTELPRPPHPEDLAYVIYTSGSTGKPKGVALPHGVLANLTAWQVAMSHPKPRTFQLAPLSFDVSFQEMFSTWCAGGTLVLCDEHLRRDAQALLALARRERVERIFLPPAMLVLIADATDPDAWPSSMREIVTAGEALRITPSIRKVLERLSDAFLCNQYGPSETHVVTQYRARAGDPSLSDVPPIGTPIDNARVRVLDVDMDPVPVGARGELYIGGPVLARGYLGRPDLTAERFVPDPYSEAPGQRLYRTGDLVRVRPDGALQFFGRADDQLKIRGYRIEPAEIECELERIAGIRAAAVVARADPSGSARLVGYLETVSGKPLDGTDPREFIRARLPQWMVPERVVFVDRLPLTPSGKVDRRALANRPLPSQSAPEGSVPPRTDLEEALCALWCEILGLKSVGVRESFFDLGGHSIAVARVAARVRQRMGVEVPLRVFFEATTVEDLAREIVVHRLAAADPATTLTLLQEVDEHRTAAMAGSR